MRLFVYGTLLPENRNHRRIAPYVKAPQPGRVRGSLVDVGDYPALIPERWLEPTEVQEADSDGLVYVCGLWYEITREGLALADRYEEFYGIEESNDYERVWIADADRPDLSGWIYIWTSCRGYPLAEVDWWPDKRKKKEP